MEGLPIGEIIQALVIPLAFVIGIVIALVEYSKKLGNGGVGCTVLSMVLGLLLGVGYYIASFGVPADFPGWFILAIVALVTGLVPSGVYDLGFKGK